METVGSLITILVKHLMKRIRMVAVIPMPIEAGQVPTAPGLINSFPGEWVQRSTA